MRAERIPDQDREAIQEIYGRIAERNVDLAGYFVYRSIEWLAEGGTFSMIVPRAIADAGYSSKLRAELAASDVSVTELTPLDWACHELFDSDNVPVIIQYERSEREAEHRVTLVHGLRSRQEILEAAQNWPRVSELPWDRFVAGAPAETWPLEATPGDVQVREWLDSFTPLGRDGGPGSIRLGIKLGARCRASDERRDDCTPLLTGSDLFPYYHEGPRRFAPVEDAADRSIWREAIWDAQAHRFHWSRFEGRDTYPVTACAKINITVNACLIDAARMACQDTTLLAEWRDELHSPGALTALLNSALSRWYAFVFLRAGVAGGGRRDYTIYPRTLNALPCPDLDSEMAANLHQLALTAADLANLAAPLDLDLWGELLEAAEPDTALSAWPLNWRAWPEDIGLSSQTLVVERLDEERLQLTRSVAITSEEPELLDFLEIYLPAVAESSDRRRTREEVQSLLVPDRTAVLGLLHKYGDALEARDRGREE
ncbi:MAG: hypothetical protein U9R79_05100, partial [Armatimonadota bacterium]|nr:hypothetical protein [Armatimonadota bacterium]